MALKQWMRQIVACAVCAIKDWIDDFYPCYMWKDPPASTVDASPQDDGSHNSDDEEERRMTHLKGPLLRDENGFYYFGSANAIHELLDVDLYVPVVPLAPLEELHASSVQHPRFHTMRWLLNTRRVPVVPTNAGFSPNAPSCAGIGDTDKPAWICHHCASHLCSRQPRMPPQALASTEIPHFVQLQADGLSPPEDE